MGSSKAPEYANTTVLAGEVKKMKVQDDNAFFLIDVTGEEKGATKWIPCTIYKDVDLMRRIERYSEGDAIKIRGFVRAWSQKKDGEWTNNVDIRVTEIKGPDPVAKSAPRGTKGRQPGADDDIPF